MAEKHQKSSYNLGNLKHDFTHEERAENGRKGGIESGKAKRRQKTWKASVQALMECRAIDEGKAALLKELGLDDTMLNQIQLSLYEKAARGDVDAARFLRDTAGEKPREGLELGNLDDKPLASLDMSKLTDEQLRIIAARRHELAEEEE